MKINIESNELQNAASFQISQATVENLWTFDDGKLLNYLAFGNISVIIIYFNFNLLIICEYVFLLHIL